ncbi:hypothetical protein AB7C87_06245 [Natrarchaeobius sp. A-rgal3]|uniref:hypothetical protein n=1 Tax=Natrarchaeobius versutus TaxID=1679078 RepID=UPI00350F7772
MTDDDRISRRASLKGIAISGTLLGGTAFGAMSASAGEKKGEKKTDGKKNGKNGKKGKKGKKDGKGKKGKKGKKDKKKKKKKHGKHVPADEVEGRVAFNFECADPQNDRALFYIHHGLDTDLTFTYKIAGTDKKGKITVEDDLATAETFWVKAPDGEARVTVYYRGTRVGGATSDPSVVCED